MHMSDLNGMILKRTNEMNVNQSECVPVYECCQCVNARLDWIFIDSIAAFDDTQAICRFVQIKMYTLFISIDEKRTHKPTIQSYPTRNMDSNDSVTF